jgi:hypothetical protein
MIPQNPKSDCGKLVDQLVALAGKQPRGTRSAAKVNIGRSMGYAQRIDLAGATMIRALACQV